MVAENAGEATSDQPRLLIGNKVFDLNALTLVDQFSQIIPLRDQSLRVLLELAVHNGQVVSKQDLVTAVWPDIAVTDDSLVQCIKNIRAALGDADRELVKTAVGRGYRLNGEPVHPISPGERPRLLISKLQTTIGDLEAIEIAAKIGEELAISLSPRAGLVVMTDEARKSDAQYLISGRVSTMGGQCRVFVQMVKRDSGTNIFAESWECIVEDMFDLPVQVIEKVTNFLRIHMIVFGGEEFVTRNNAELSAQALLSKAAYHMSRFEATNWHEARAALEMAVELDPHNPVALAMLASMATQMTPQVPFQSLPDDVEHIFKLADRAVELGQNIDFVLRTRGNLRLWLLGDHEGARIDCERSLAINPTFHLSHLTIATSEILAGSPAAGIARMHKMMSLMTTDPQYPLYVSLISVGHMLLKNSVEAFEAAREGYERNSSASWNALVYATSAAGRTNVTDTPQFRSLLAKINLPFCHFRDMPFTNPSDIDILEKRLRSVGFEPQ